MRPLFAIAPLALALMLLGPVTQAPQPQAAPQSLLQALAEWLGGGQPAEAVPAAPLPAASATVASVEAPAAR